MVAPLTNKECNPYDVKGNTTRHNSHCIYSTQHWSSGKRSNEVLTFEKNFFKKSSSPNTKSCYAVIINIHVTDNMYVTLMLSQYCHFQFYSLYDIKNISKS